MFAPKCFDHSSQSLASLQDFFKLPEEENILESFKCSLLQTVDCTHNEYTRGLQLTLPGILCVTDVHVCFVGDDTASVPPFKLPHKRVAKVSSPRPATRGGAVAMLHGRNTHDACATGPRLLRLDIGESHHLVFAKFVGSQLDDAFALVELKQQE